MVINLIFKQTLNKGKLIDGKSIEDYTPVLPIVVPPTSLVKTISIDFWLSFKKPTGAVVWNCTTDPPAAQYVILDSYPTISPYIPLFDYYCSVKVTSKDTRSNYKYDKTTIWKAGYTMKIDIPTNVLYTIEVKFYDTSITTCYNGNNNTRVVYIYNYASSSLNSWPQGNIFNLIYDSIYQN